MPALLGLESEHEPCPILQNPDCSWFPGLRIAPRKAETACESRNPVEEPHARRGPQESTILSFHTTLLHHGMVIVGLPYTFQGQMRIDEVTGGSPYGTSTIAGGKGERMASENEIAAARFQGQHVAQIAKKLWA